MKTYKMISLLAVVVGLVLASASARAAVVLFSSPVSGTGLRDATVTVGVQFTPTSTIAVTELGFFDYGANGLAATHQVGLWTNAGTLLDSVTVQTSSTLDGQFRYELLSTPIILTAGVTYRLGAIGTTGDGDLWYEKNAGEFAVGAPVTINNKAYSTATGFNFPSETWSSGGAYIAGNLIGEVVPEPSTLVLFGGGGLLVWWRRRNPRSVSGCRPGC